ncbi:MAG: hypothetical protein F4Z62_06955 [Rhodothermaceae bacterium]|nr:hypothetical protein [Rhodothermaceae bacterium]
MGSITSVIPYALFRILNLVEKQFEDSRRMEMARLCAKDPSLHIDLGDTTKAHLQAKHAGEKSGDVHILFSNDFVCFLITIAIFGVWVLGKVLSFNSGGFGWEPWEQNICSFIASYWVTDISFSSLRRGFSKSVG